MIAKSDGGVKKDNSRWKHVPYLIRRGGEVSFAGQTIRVGRESMIWKCLVSCGSKPIDRWSSATSTLSAKSAGRVYDILVDTENEIKPAPLSHPGFKVTSHQTAFYGACKHCAR